MKCKCGNTRFRTKNKNTKTYMCRACHAIYRNGEIVKTDPAAGAELVTTDLGRQFVKVDPAPVAEPAVVAPIAEPVAEKLGIFGTIKRVMGLI